MKARYFRFRSNPTANVQIPPSSINSKQVRCYNLFFNQSAFAKIKKKWGELGSGHDEFNDVHNPIPKQMQNYLLDLELLSVKDFVELNEFRSDDAIFISPFDVSPSFVDQEDIKVIIRGFNRNEFSKQSGIKDQKDILIYYYSEPKQLQKLLNYAESFKGYQMIVVLSNSMYENNGAKHALFNTLQANNNIGLVLIDKKNEIPAFKRILSYLKLDAQLDDYCEKRNFEPVYLRTLFNFFNFGFSKSAKIAAAQTLQDVIRGKASAEDLVPHEKTLSQGRLRQIYYEYLKFSSILERAKTNVCVSPL